MVCGCQLTSSIFPQSTMCSRLNQRWSMSTLPFGAGCWPPWPARSPSSSQAVPWPSTLRRRSDGATRRPWFARGALVTAGKSFGGSAPFEILRHPSTGSGCEAQDATLNMQGTPQAGSGCQVRAEARCSQSAAPCLLACDQRRDLAGSAINRDGLHVLVADDRVLRAVGAGDVAGRPDGGSDLWHPTANRQRASCRS